MNSKIHDKQEATPCLLEQYLDFLADTEPPQQFHRWAFLSCIGAQLSRNIYITHGHQRIYPNMYVMLVGAPATRKSTSIKIAKKLIEDAGYTNFAFSKSSKQKFLLDWSDGYIGSSGALTLEDALDIPINTVVGELTSKSEFVSDCFIAQDEFIDFIGQGNFEFISLLTTLWDNPEKYDERFKNSNSVSIPNPTLSILGGITPSSLAMALPAEANGSGFLSRLLLVYSEPSGKKIAFPSPPDEASRLRFVNSLAKVRQLRGECRLSMESKELLTRIYHSWENHLDVKLEYYAGRRLTHLLKLCMICAALRHSLDITAEDVIKANSLLFFTETGMSTALQYIGSAKNLEATSKALDYITRSDKPLSLRDLFIGTRTYFEKLSDLMVVLNNLVEAGKVRVESAHIYPIRARVNDVDGCTNLSKYIREYKGELHERVRLVD